MKLVVLDGFALNPGDLSWDPLYALAAPLIQDRIAESEIVSSATGAEILLTNKTPLRRKTLEALPDLQYIGVLATGYDIVDAEYAATRGIVVTNVPAYGTDSVAQMVFALILELSNRTGVHNDAVCQLKWSRNPDWCFRQTPMVELAGKTLGIVGFGRIGRRVADIARAFGMHVVATGRSRPADLPDGVQWVELDRLFSSADIVSLHCPLQASTRGLINSARIARMKPTALLINTARGALVVEDDLAEALNSGRLGGAGLDVLSTEPPGANNPLLGATNCIVTPHIAWATREARERLLETAITNLRMWMEGNPRNVVNPGALDQ
ncbi:MAG TPA: D-2-hydroxyacid dehydrogenase [Acidobacteriaceae bacterium]